MSIADKHERPGTVLRGRALPAARAAWVALVATVLALFVTGLPAATGPRASCVRRPSPGSSIWASPPASRPPT